MRAAKATWTPFGEIEPCPACGSAAELPWPAAPRGDVTGVTHLSPWRARCSRCGLEGAPRATADDALDAWNASCENLARISADV